MQCQNHLSSVFYGSFLSEYVLSFFLLSTINRSSHRISLSTSTCYFDQISFYFFLFDVSYFNVTFTFSQTSFTIVELYFIFLIALIRLIFMSFLIPMIFCAPIFTFSFT